MLEVRKGYGVMESMWWCGWSWYSCLLLSVSWVSLLVLGGCSRSESVYVHQHQR